MDFEQVLKGRFSVKKFTDRPIEQEKLDAILEAGRLAPTAKNIQPQKIYVIRSAEALAKANELSPCIYGAPVVLMFAYDTDEEWKSPLEEGFTAGQQDTSIAATQMMLEAWNLGIGSCWVNFFSQTAAKKAYGLPENEQVLLLMPIGYAAEGTEPLPMHSKSRDIEEIVTYL